MAERSRGLLLAGVGGQGVVLASMIVADALVRAGHDVKQSEVHGMAQRGGSVFSHIRWGEKVDSPLVALAGAEVLAAFEWAEALRWMPYVRPGGAVVADVRTVVPPGACADRRSWVVPYPDVDLAPITERRLQARLLDAAGVATGLGQVRAANSVILGAVAEFLDVSLEHWEEAIGRLVPPGTVEANLAAFHAGRTEPTAAIGQPAAKPVGSPSRYRVVIRHEWCKGCDICSRVCPEHALLLDADGTLMVSEADACTGCELCEMLCPDFAISIHPDRDDDRGDGVEWPGATNATVVPGRFR
ncbi:MAG: 2-oxoacid:acceptor oxidoreductase family protein [Acidimicrobiia bacterium]|nr:2-oxoacid:acceptor oxidoreductase family protein [Acidimicrobiia bacterium]